MKLNASKTKTMTVTWSRTIHPQSTSLTLGGTVLKESADLVILEVMFDAKIIISITLLALSLCFQSCSSEAGIMRKSWQYFMISHS